MSTSDALTNLQNEFSTLDFSDTSSLKSAVVSVNIAFITLIVLVVGLRLYIRLVMVRAAGLDDLLMVLAAVFAIVLCSLALVGAQHGLGQHIWTISSDLPVFLQNIRGFTQALYGCYLSYATAITFTKCSIVASYLRLFPNEKFRWIIKIAAVVIIALWICSVFAIIFECIPVQAAWDWTITNAKCIDIVTYLIVSSSVNIVTDLILCVAPIPILYKMNMSLSQRMILCVVFGFGLFACIASMLRLAHLPEARSADITYGTASGVDWSVAEVGTAILCACVPSMRPLAVKLFPNSGFQTRRSHGAISSYTAEMNRQRITTRGQSVPSKVDSASGEGESGPEKVINSPSTTDWMEPVPS